MPDNLFAEQLLLNSAQLPRNWNARYGITDDRRAALLDVNRDGVAGSNSFYNGTSETAMTLFALGRSDQWLQAASSVDWWRYPRSGKSWNRDFFLHLRLNPARLTEVITPLRELIVKVANVSAEAAKNGVLLFELQVNSNAALSDQSAMSIPDITFSRICTGTQFDAVLAISDGRQSGHLVCIEAKLEADQGEDQIRRGVEAAFFLTRIRRSVFHGWDYSYIFLHPPERTYERDYAFVAQPDAALEKYGEELTSGIRPSNSNFANSARWPEFIRSAPSRIHEVTWSDLLDAVSSDGWSEDEYHKRIAESTLPRSFELAAASRKRLQIARGRNDLDDLLAR